MSAHRVKLNMKGIRAVLKSQPVIDEVARRAHRIKMAAGDGFVVVVKPHKYTARAFVQTDTPEAARRQAESKVLNRALDAGR